MAEKGEENPTDAGNKEYKVGYGKPPLHPRWKKGQSGNPGGRPKGLVKQSALYQRFRAMTPEEFAKYKPANIGEQQAMVTFKRSLMADDDAISLRYIQEVHDRADGKPRQEVAHTVDDATEGPVIIVEEGYGDEE